MATITLTIQEFINFKTIYKDKYLSKVQNGNVQITANIDKLALFGYF